MHTCSGARCPIRSYCQNYFNASEDEALHPYFSPCEIADGLVSCTEFRFNRKEYTETLTLTEIVSEHLLKRHSIKSDLSDEGYLQSSILDVLTVTHIDTSRDYSVFAVYSIFEESEEGDRSTIYALSMVLNRHGKIIRECSLPEQRVFI